MTKSIIHLSNELSMRIDCIYSDVMLDEKGKQIYLYINAQVSAILRIP